MMHRILSLFFCYLLLKTLLTTVYFIYNPITSNFVLSEDLSVMGGGEGERSQNSTLFGSNVSIKPVGLHNDRLMYVL